ncbi:discoidin domain-containing protein [Enterococcus faecalis]|nr:discoidin domain-containing protein [Enterococcus faecalis]MCC4085820.1 discoidin domain-containing protein [Enterococcus faecalis]
MAVVTLAGCNMTDSAKSKILYTQTEESKMNRPMDNQPESSYWFPEELLSWSFSDDEDAKYNVSTVPLAKRVNKKKLSLSNDTQIPEMNVVALSIMNSNTSGNAPRGINTFDANVFSNWQYIDQLVYWGGSSGEGIIVAPSADVVDAAHKNGVPVLGTIFFPQTVHGGKLEWLDTFLEKDENGKFLLVDKLIEVSEAYGFDGWFINQETDTKVTSFDEIKERKSETKGEEDGSSEGLNKKHADLMQEFIAQFKEKKKNLEIMWYDSMTSDGKMDWQNGLTDKNKSYLVDAQMKPLSDSMFLNFWWNTEDLAEKELLKASQEKAKELKLNPYNLYAGIDVQENGYLTPVDWKLFTDKEGTPYTSLGLYVPSWTHSSASTPDDFQSREELFWVNAKGDPTKSTTPEGTQWPGISTYAVEQTAITELPFVTNFNVGNGYNYFINGEKVSNMDWNNRSMQDIMPTYRWTFTHEKENALAVTIDYADAFYGGNSLLFRGKMQKDAKSTVKLYRLESSFEKNTVFTTIAKSSDETELSLVLGYDDGSKESFKADKKIGKEWTTAIYDVKKATDKVVTSISYEITSSKENNVYELHLGQLAITNGKESDLSISDVKVEDTVFDEEESNYAGVRLTWDGKENKASHYEIYRVNEDDSRSFLGATPATNHYINGLERTDETNKTKFEVVPVDLTGKRGKTSKTVTMEWPNNQRPKAGFTVSRTLSNPGEKITFTNTSSSNTKRVLWEFEGGDVTTSTDDNPTVVYEKEGVYKVKMTAENKYGKMPIEMEKLITISSKVPEELTLLSQKASTEASSFTNETEGPVFAVDGKLDTKWCATGTTPHEIIVDLGSVKTVSEVHLAHAEAGGESSDMNTKAYTIEISEDGEEFTKVSRTINNTAANSVNTFSAQKARYVKLVVDKPTQGSDFAVRIYELSVYGIEDALK